MSRTQIRKSADIVGLNTVGVTLSLEDYKILDNAGSKPELSLLFKSKATHAMRGTANFGIYAPAYMKQALKSWTKPFQKPVMIYHDSQRDNIGRVVEARYVPIPTPLISVDDYNTLQNTTKIQTIVDLFNKYYDVFTDYYFEGLGYVDIDARVVDEEAIDKILKGTYLTQSVGFSVTGDVFDSLEGKSMKKGESDFWPGSIDEDGRRVYLIPTGIVFDEVSFVNEPADAFAMLYEYEHESANENSPVVDEQAVKQIDYQLFLESKFKDHVQINQIKLHGGNKKMKKKFSDLLASTEASYSVLKDKLPADVVMTAEQLTALDDSKFAGPNRTFPVPDKAHKDAYLAALAEYEGSDAHKLIADAINGVEVQASQEGEGAESSPATADGANIDNPPPADLTPVVTGLMDAVTAGTFKDTILPLFTDEQLAQIVDIFYQVGIEKGFIKKADEQALVDVQVQADDMKAANAILTSQLDSLKKLADTQKTSLAEVNQQLAQFLTDAIAAMRLASGNDDIADLQGKTHDALLAIYQEYKRIGDGVNSRTSTVPGPDAQGKPSQDDEAYQAELAKLRKRAFAMECDAATGPAGAAEWLRMQVDALNKKFNK